MLSEHLMCYMCSDVYDAEYMKPEYDEDTCTMIYRCPKLSCGHPLIPCDDLMMPIIYELNRKSMTTYFSCSGHHGENTTSTYVVFSVPDTLLEDVIAHIVTFSFNGIRFSAKLCERVKEGDAGYFFNTLKEYGVFNYKSNGTNAQQLSTKLTSLVDTAADEIQNGKNICVHLYLYDDETTPKIFSLNRNPWYLVDVNYALLSLVKSFSDEYRIITD